MELFGDSKGEFVFDSDSDSFDLPACNPVPEVEAMRAACASGDLRSDQPIFQTYWLERPVNERTIRLV